MDYTFRQPQVFSITFSPYDAYFKYSETSTEKFVDIKEGLIAKELNIKRSLLQTKYEAILSYFGLADPVVTFANKGTSFCIQITH